MQKLETAVHEAGHGVAAAALGFRVYFLSLAESLDAGLLVEGQVTGASMIDFSPGSAGRGAVAIDRTRRYSEGTFACGEPAFAALADEGRTDVAAILIAGRIAQARLGVHPVLALSGAAGDVAREQQLFGLMREGPRERHEERAYRRAKGIVVREWGAICLVALAIVTEGGRLDGEALERGLDARRVARPSWSCG